MPDDRRDPHPPFREADVSAWSNPTVLERLEQFLRGDKRPSPERARLAEGVASIASMIPGPGTIDAMQMLRRGDGVDDYIGGGLGLLMAGAARPGMKGARSEMARRKAARSGAIGIGGVGIPLGEALAENPNAPASGVSRLGRNTLFEPYGELPALRSAFAKGGAVDRLDYWDRIPLGMWMNPDDQSIADYRDTELRDMPRRGKPDLTRSRHGIDPLNESRGRALRDLEGYSEGGDVDDEMSFEDQPVDDETLSEVINWLTSQGRKGDTTVAHINPREAAILKSLGGSGTRNPDTGLPEFFDGDDDGADDGAGDGDFGDGDFGDGTAGSGEEGDGQSGGPSDGDGADGGDGEAGSSESGEGQSGGSSDGDGAGDGGDGMDGMDGMGGVGADAGEAGSSEAGDGQAGSSSDAGGGLGGLGDTGIGDDNGPAGGFGGVAGSSETGEGQAGTSSDATGGMSGLGDTSGNWSGNWGNEFGAEWGANPAAASPSDPTDSMSLASLGLNIDDYALNPDLSIADPNDLSALNDMFAAAPFDPTQVETLPEVTVTAEAPSDPYGSLNFSAFGPAPSASELSSLTFDSTPVADQSFALSAPTSDPNAFADMTLSPNAVTSTFDTYNAPSNPTASFSNTQAGVMNDLGLNTYANVDTINTDPRNQDNPLTDTDWSAQLGIPGLTIGPGFASSSTYGSPTPDPFVEVIPENDLPQNVQSAMQAQDQAIAAAAAAAAQANAAQSPADVGAQLASLSAPSAQSSESPAASASQSAPSAADQAAATQSASQAAAAALASGASPAEAAQSAAASLGALGYASPDEAAPLAGNPNGSPATAQNAITQAISQPQIAEAPTWNQNIKVAQANMRALLGDTTGNVLPPLGSMGGAPTTSGAGSLATLATDAPADAVVNARARYADTKAPPSEVDWLAHAMIGEARGEGPAGMLAVGQNVNNRANTNFNRFGNTVASQVQARSQYSYLNDSNRAVADRARATNSPQWQSAQQLARAILEGRVADPTKGAMMYHNPAITQGNRASRAHQLAERNGFVDIGGHRFSDFRNSGSYYQGSKDNADLPAPGAVENASLKGIGKALSSLLDSLPPLGAPKGGDFSPEARAARAAARAAAAAEAPAKFTNRAGPLGPLALALGSPAARAGDQASQVNHSSTFDPGMLAAVPPMTTDLAGLPASPPPSGVVDARGAYGALPGLASDEASMALGSPAGRAGDMASSARGNAAAYGSVAAGAPTAGMLAAAATDAQAYGNLSPLASLPALSNDEATPITGRDFGSNVLSEAAPQVRSELPFFAARMQRGFEPTTGPTQGPNLAGVNLDGLPPGPVPSGIPAGPQAAGIPGVTPGLPSVTMGSPISAPPLTVPSSRAPQSKSMDELQIGDSQPAPFSPLHSFSFPATVAGLAIPGFGLANLASRAITGKGLLNNVAQLAGLPEGRPMEPGENDIDPSGDGEDQPVRVAPTSPYTYSPPTGSQAGAPNPAWGRAYVPATGDLRRYGIDRGEHTFFTNNNVPGQAA